MRGKIKECEAALSVIPSGLTRRLKPLDISITKCLKKVQETRMWAIELATQYKSIEHCNHRMDWLIMVFIFCYNQ